MVPWTRLLHLLDNFSHLLSFSLSFKCPCLFSLVISSLATTHWTVSLLRLLSIHVFHITPLIWFVIFSYLEAFVWSNHVIPPFKVLPRDVIAFRTESKLLNRKLWPPLSLSSSATALLSNLHFPKHSVLFLASGPLYILFPLPGPLFFHCCLLNTYLNPDIFGIK